MDNSVLTSAFITILIGIVSSGLTYLAMTRKSLVSKEKAEANLNNMKAQKTFLESDELVKRIREAPIDTILKTYEQLRSAYADMNENLQEQVTELHKEMEVLRNDYSHLWNENMKLKERVNNLTIENTNLKSQIAELSTKVNGSK